jgi:hypothetical protein
MLSPFLANAGPHVSSNSWFTNHPRFSLRGGDYTCHLLSRWFLSQLIISAPKMEAISSSETSVNSQRTTWRYIPKGGTLHEDYCFLCCDTIGGYKRFESTRCFDLQGRITASSPIFYTISNRKYKGHSVTVQVYRKWVILNKICMYNGNWKML